MRHDEDLRRSLRPDAISRRVHGAGRPGASRAASAWSCGAIGARRSARCSARPPTGPPPFLENPVRGEILRVATRRGPRRRGRARRVAQAGLRRLPRVHRQATAPDGPGRRRGILGGERIVFYYLAEKRVDFRELVKDLARAFQTRIEMRQIGVRDEAKLLADYGDCGKPVCCNTHLSRMPPVSMRMAKMQKTTLDPSKISGRCGRLKCCLRYEFDTYQALERELPAVGSKVVTPRGQGRVLALEVLAQKVVVEFEDRRRIVVGADEILGVEKSKARPLKDEDDDRVEP